jgi:hypothetical protein
MAAKLTEIQKENLIFGLNFWLIFCIILFLGAFGPGPLFFWLASFWKSSGILQQENTKKPG